MVRWCCTYHGTSSSFTILQILLMWCELLEVSHINNYDLSVCIDSVRYIRTYYVKDYIISLILFNSHLRQLLSTHRHNRRLLAEGLRCLTRLSSHFNCEQMEDSVMTCRHMLSAFWWGHVIPLWCNMTSMLS